MVGVPGKFKGCNTCRTRRVRCDNQRPECKKCIDNGWRCQGYIREPLFIVSTSANRGRCCSHPHRSSMPKRQKPSDTPASTTTLSSCMEVEDENGVSQDQISGTVSDRMRCVAFQASQLPLNPVYTQDGDYFVLSSVSHEIPDVSREIHATEFALRALCLVQPPKEKSRANRGGQETASRAEDSAKSILFVYEICPSSASPRNPTTRDVQVTQACAWRRIFGGNARLMKQRGPSCFTSFPHHHFFTRLYRKEAIFNAMMRRKDTFLALPEWRAVPWERIPKNEMDRLFDIQVLLPGIFERGERLENYQPSFPRRLKAKDLLQNCFQIDKSFYSWYTELESQCPGQLFWRVSAQFDEAVSSDAPPTRLEFVNLKMAFLHIYYWAALCVFYRSIQHIHTLYAEEIIASPSVPLSFQSPTPQIAPIVSPNQKQTQPRPGPQFIPALPPNEFLELQSTMLPLQGFDLTAIQSPYGQAFHEQQHHRAYQYSTPSPTFPEYAIPTTPSFPSSLPYAAQSPLAPSSIAFSQPPRSQPTSAPFYQSPSYPFQSYESTPTPTATPSNRPSMSSSQSQGPILLPPVPPLDSKYGESAVFELANAITQALPYILGRTSSTTASGAASQATTPCPPFSPSDSPLSWSFGPDHALWPLNIARQVYRRQNRIEHLAWCGKQIDVMRREGALMAQKASQGVWQELSEGNVET